MSQSSRTEFSYRGRTHNLSRLRAELFDLLVIGGGITGAGIARDAALRGYKVALLEKDDFASGTSSKSTKLVHAGLRYLETYQFHLVYEASHERRVLHQIAPNLVQPLQFVYPLYRGSLYGPFLTRIGFLLYDALALFRNFGTYHMLTTEQVGQRITELDTSRITGGATYFDGQTDDARLTLENARSAARSGAAVLNHFHVDDLTFGKNGNVNGIRGHDALSGERYDVRARVVVNATGPWANNILEMDHQKTRSRVRPSKGVHIYVPRARFPIPSAVAFRVPFDNRLMFAIPWGQQTLIGTTDTFYEGSPDEVLPEPSDIAYILRAVNAAFPNARMTNADILSAFAGLRPLIATGSSNGPGAISREHKIWTTDSGLINIAGGKLTTYRVMAAQTVNAVAARLKKEAGLEGTPARTDTLPLTELEPGDARRREAAMRSLPRESVEHLLHFYGPRHGRVLDYITQNAKYGRPIVDGLPYIWAEVPHAVEHEMAMNVRDVLARRLHLLYEAPDGASEVARGVAEEFDRRLDWTVEDRDRELMAYFDEIQRAHHGIREAAVSLP